MVTHISTAKVEQAISELLVIHTSIGDTGTLGIALPSTCESRWGVHFAFSLSSQNEGTLPVNAAVISSFGIFSSISIVRWCAAVLYKSQKGVETAGRIYFANMAIGSELDVGQPGCLWSSSKSTDLRSKTCQHGARSLVL